MNLKRIPEHLNRSSCVFIFSLLLVFTIWPGVRGPVRAATLNATTCGQADVQSSINAAESGDVVTVPAGSCTWNSVVNLNKNGITLSGAGKDSTLITTGPGGYLWVNPGTNGWNISRIGWRTGDSGSAYSVLVGQYSMHANSGWTIGDCDFRRSVAQAGTGNYHPITIIGRDTGVIFQNDFWGGGPSYDADNDYPWTASTGLGESDYVFIEGNRFSDLYAMTQGVRGVYGGNGARYVIRYNSFLAEGTVGMSNPIDGHGYCHSQHGRGVRSYEIYNNLMQASANWKSSRAMFLRSGTGVVFNNKIDMTRGAYSNAAIDLFDYRMSAGAVGTAQMDCSPDCPAANGTSAFCAPTYYRLQTTGAATLFSEGEVVTGATSGATGTIWSITSVRGQYINFLNTVAGPGGNFQSGESLIVEGSAVTTAAANLELMHGEGYPCCDQIGRGINNSSEPYYLWNNTDQNGAPVNPSIGGMIDSYIQSERDYVLASKSGYTPYSCPHPFTKLTGTCDSGMEGTMGYNLLPSDSTPPALPVNLIVQ